MDPAIIVSVVSAAVTIPTVMLTYRASARANASADRRVDLEEHRDSIDRLMKIIDEQDKHFERVRQQVLRVQEQLSKEQDVSLSLRYQVRNLQDQVDDLMRSRARLEILLQANAGKGRQE